MNDVTAVEAADPKAVLEQALAAHLGGQFDEAERLYRQLLARNPADHNALTNLGTVALQRGRLAEGVAFIEASLKINPNQANAINNRGNALLSLGRVEEALKAFERALELNPANAEAHSNRGVALADLGRKEDAIGAYQRALELRPDFIDALNGLGIVLQELGRQEEALAIYDRALLTLPDSWELHYNRGNSLRALNRPLEALAAYDKGLSLTATPRAAMLSNRAVALLALGRYDEALAGCEQAIALDPDYVDAQWNKALILLMKGDYLPGWRQYEWRWRQSQYKGGEVQEGVRWLGETPLQGKRLLMFYEQGLGDTLQMLRYAAVAAKQGAEVGVVVPPALQELAATTPGVSQSLIGGEPVAYHFWTPMMSLPMAFGSTLDTVPSEVPYLFTPEAAKATWAKRLGPRTRPRVGLAWSGSSTHGNDANRSLAFETLAALLDADAEFFSLQVEYRDGDRARLQADGRVRDVSGELKSFTDTAALIDAMDLVVTVDTSVAHLAGALGKPTLVLLAFVPDFRWGLGSERTPWYPTARLLRQPAIGAWAPVIAQARDEIARLVG